MLFLATITWAATGPCAPRRVRTLAVFGKSKFFVHVRLLLARSHVFSRLFQGTQAWSAVSLWSVKKLNTVCVGVLRRIAAKLRYHSSANHLHAHCPTQARLLTSSPHLSGPATSFPVGCQRYGRFSPCCGSTLCSRIFGC